MLNIGLKNEWSAKSQLKEWSEMLIHSLKQWSEMLNQSWKNGVKC